MTDSTALLIVGLFSAFAISALIYALISERERRRRLERNLFSVVRERTMGLFRCIAEGRAHPLRAWRVGAGLSASDIAKALRITEAELARIEEGQQHDTDTIHIAAVIASCRPFVSDKQESSGVSAMSTADNPHAGSADGAANSGSVSTDGGGGAGGAM